MFNICDASILDLSETGQTNEKQVEINFEIIFWIFWLIIYDSV